MKRTSDSLKNRKHSFFTSTISGDRDSQFCILGTPLVEVVKKMKIAQLVGSLFLGRRLKSKKTVQLINMIILLSVDHGPYVSGAVNTMIAARAGKDMVSSVASGMLTIGKRFGGATNNAARVWLNHAQKADPHYLVEQYASERRYIPGIGHRKYRIDMPDPRVTQLTSFVNGLYTQFARSVEKVTTAKKPNLILNVDGAIACVLLDLLTKEENISENEINKLIDAEFFNSFFVFARTAGLIAHFIDQKKLNEPLFRLRREDVFIAPLDNS